MPNCNTRKGDLHILMLVAISLVSSLAFQRTWLLECALILVAACCHVSFTANLIGLSWNAVKVRGGTFSQLQPVVGEVVRLCTN